MEKGNNQKKLDQAIFERLLIVRRRDVTVSALILKTKAMEFAAKMTVYNFNASYGWLDRWKKQYNISFKMVSGEANACTSEMVAAWGENMLQTM